MEPTLSFGDLLPVAVGIALSPVPIAAVISSKTWLIRNNAAVIGVLLLVFGVKLLAEGLQGLIG